MANRRLTMNRTREILRLRWEQGQGVRATGRAVGVGRSAVRSYDQKLCSGVS